MIICHIAQIKLLISGQFNQVLEINPGKSIPYIVKVNHKTLPLIQKNENNFPF